MGWLREAISDDCGMADMAYIVIGSLAVSAIFALAFIFGMSAIDYHNCTPTLTISTGDTDSRHVVPCRFDPLPVGQAAGLIFGAFGALIGALAGYMAATRRQARTTSSSATVTATSTKES
jgi:hypothetical protein